MAAEVFFLRHGSINIGIAVQGQLSEKTAAAAAASAPHRRQWRRQCHRDIWSGGCGDNKDDICKRPFHRAVHAIIVLLPSTVLQCDNHITFVRRRARESSVVGETVRSGVGTKSRFFSNTFPVVIQCFAVLW